MGETITIKDKAAVSQNIKDLDTHKTTATSKGDAVKSLITSFATAGSVTAGSTATDQKPATGVADGCGDAVGSQSTTTSGKLGSAGQSLDGWLKTQTTVDNDGKTKVLEA